jgi:hypothetical protein
MEANMCIALTSKQKRCKNGVRSGLFCHWHRSNASCLQDHKNPILSVELNKNICLGITTKNKRCKNRINIHATLYCHYHKSQKQAESPVEAIGSIVDSHASPLDKIIVCMGVTSKNQRCKITVRNGDNFCRHHQQGKLMASSFRSADNRRQILLQVLMLRENKDMYTGILISDASLFQLDHVVELHFVANAWNEMATAIESHRVGLFSAFLRQHVNDTMNLNLTSKRLNLAKFRALKKFESSQNQEGGFLPFLLDEGIHPIIIYNICQSMVLALKYLQSFYVPQQFYEYTQLWRLKMKAKFENMKIN